MSMIYTPSRSILKLIAISAYVVISGVFTMGYSQISLQYTEKQLVDTNTVYVVSPVVKDTSSVVMNNPKVEQKDWIICILEATKNKKSGAKETYKPLQEVKLDIYYWMHYLDKEIPAVI